MVFWGSSFWNKNLHQKKGPWKKEDSPFPIRHMTFLRLFQVASPSAKAQRQGFKTDGDGWVMGEWCSDVFEKNRCICCWRLLFFGSFLVWWMKFWWCRIITIWGNIVFHCFPNHTKQIPASGGMLNRPRWIKLAKLKPLPVTPKQTGSWGPSGPKPPIFVYPIGWLNHHWKAWELWIYFF